METSAAILSRLEELSREVADLRQRLTRLEKAGPGDVAEPQTPVTAPPADELELASLAAAAGMVPAAGRLFLGIAGAFVLRAVAESGYLHPLLAVALAVVYAASWLVSAIRLAATSHLMAGAHVLTAALIAYPMLWETTMRFHALSPGAAAALLAAFTILGLAVTWKRDLGEIVWITALAGAGSALGLLVATHDLAVFTAALLAMALAVEAGATADQWLRVRIPVALAADLAVLLTGWLAGRAEGLPASYAPVSVPAGVALHAALLAIYGGSVAFRVFVRGKRIRFFEIGQSIAAFLIGIFGLVRIGKTAGPAGALCLAAGLICYAAAFGILARRGGRDRTFLVYSTFGLALLLAAPLIAGGILAATLLWAGVAVAGVALGHAPGRRDLRFHGTAYLAAAILISGLGLFASQALLGAATATAAVVLLAMLAGGIAYGFEARRRVPAPRWTDVLPAFVAAGAVCWAALGLAAFWIFPGAGAVAVVARTVLLAAAALALRFAGERLARPELVWMVYPLMLFAAYKLFTQDFQTQPAALAVSLVVFGGAMLLLPRIRPAALQEIGASPDHVRHAS